MNKGDKRRNRRKQKLRYDRVAITAVVLVLLIVMITACTKSCAEKKENHEPDIQQNNSQVQEETSISPETTEAELAQPTAESAEETQPETTEPPAEEPTPETTEEPTEEITEEPTEEPTEPPTEDNFPGEGFVAEKYNNSEVYKGNLILVNSSNSYRFIEDDASLLTLYDHKNHNYNSSDFSVKLDAQVIEALNKMMTAFLKAEKREDSNIWIIDGYRTYDEQESKYYNGSSIFAAGYSDYHTGRTFDMAVFEDEDNHYPFAPVGDYKWFEKNACEYGFIVRFPEDKENITGEKSRARTYRYTGVPHSVYMYRNNLCFEEYIEELKSHNKDNPLEIKVNKKEYKIYYVQASGYEETEIPVPEHESYTVSGNNCDGFIVTVNP